MHRVLVLGAGKIGSLVACLLSESGDYEVSLGDISLEASKRLVEDLGLAHVTPLHFDARHPDGEMNRALPSGWHDRLAVEGPGPPTVLPRASRRSGHSVVVAPLLVTLTRGFHERT